MRGEGTETWPAAALLHGNAGRLLPAGGGSSPDTSVRKRPEATVALAPAGRPGSVPAELSLPSRCDPPPAQVECPAPLAAACAKVAPTTMCGGRVTPAAPSGRESALETAPPAGTNGPNPELCPAAAAPAAAWSSAGSGPGLRRLAWTARLRRGRGRGRGRRVAAAAAGDAAARRGW